MLGRFASDRTTAVTSKPCSSASRTIWTPVRPFAPRTTSFMTIATLFRVIEFVGAAVALSKFVQSMQPHSTLVQAASNDGIYEFTNREWVSCILACWRFTQSEKKKPPRGTGGAAYLCRGGWPGRRRRHLIAKTDFFAKINAVSVPDSQIPPFPRLSMVANSLLTPRVLEFPTAWRFCWVAIACGYAHKTADEHSEHLSA